MIFADSNEEGTSRIPQILKDWGVPIVLIPQGFDYIVRTKNSAVAVERKTAGDYLQSLESGHLNNQLVEMSRNFQLSYLVIYGDMNIELLKREKYPASYISSLIGDSLKHSADGIQGQIITINDTAIVTETDFATFLKHLNIKLENEDFIRLPKIVRVKMTDEDYALRLLVHLPGVGEKRAKDILFTCGSLESFITSIVYGTHIQVRGITPKLQEQYHTILTKKYGET